MAKTQVLIVGAGPTGLVLALWLAKLGITARIIDKTAEPGTSSRAVAVAARTLELHDQVGVADVAVNGGVEVPWLNLWVRGSRAARVPFGRMGAGTTAYPFMLVFPQDAHERLLIEHLQSLGVEVERKTELVRFEQRPDGVRALLKRPDGATETCDATYLAGCDGASSTVRQTLATGFPGGTYSEIFYVADVDAAGPATEGGVHVDLDEADFLAVFPLRGKGRVRLIGSVRPNRAGDHRQFTFDDIGDRVIKQMQFTIEKVNWFSTYHVHHRVAVSFRSARAFLVGDAAHIHSPAGGQGMNTGIGDAANLAWKLAAVLNGHARDALLDSYEAERIGFARRLVATTDRIFTFATAQGRLARIVRTHVVPWLAPLLFSVPAVRRFMFRTVSQIGVNYRASPLSAGAAGRVRGGDRLPWVRIGPTDDNFSVLASLTWQVHIYGASRDDVEAVCAALRLPLHVFAWQRDMRRAGLVKDALYLIRPDGYIGMIDRDCNPQRLRDYLSEHGLSLA